MQPLTQDSTVGASTFRGKIIINDVLINYSVKLELLIEVISNSVFSVLVVFHIDTRGLLQR